jgi:hypothetical protein
MKNTKYLKIFVVVVLLIFISASLYDFHLSNIKDERIERLNDTILKVSKNNELRIYRIDSSLSKYNLKTSGDTVIPINIINFSDNPTINVTSKDQKGGQTAGTIVNH